MEKVTQRQVNTSELSTVTVNEYNFSGGVDANVARVELRGRYPEKGQAVNTECDEIVYVNRGNGTLFSVGGEVDFKEGDSLCIEKGEAYAWEGKCELIIYCNPAFTPEQHEEIENGS